MDFNGVIINDEPIQMKAYQEIFQTEGVELTEEQYYSCGGMDDVTFLKHNYKRAGKDLTDEKIAELRERKSQAWRKIVDEEVPIFPGVENFIKKCSTRFAMGVVSMANRVDIEYILHKTNLRDSFLTIVSAEDVTACKPDPQAYIEGFRQLDKIRLAQGHYPLLHKECLVIEDVPQGIQAGKSAGMQVLGVTNTFDAETLRKANADSVTHSLEDWMPESLVRVFSKTI
jgi:beta-phosphoglucomutase